MSEISIATEILLLFVQLAARYEDVLQNYSVV
jgi:hypothetical protein